MLFDVVGVIPRLYVRCWTEEGTPGEWVLALPPQAFRWRSLFFNPAGNLQHALCHRLDRLLENPEEVESRRVVERYLRFFLRTRRLMPEGTRFDYKLTALHVSSSGSEERDWIVSGAEAL